jgi:hypothetical protein
MLRTFLLATAMLAASGTALAHGDNGYGRVVSVEPHFVISFGTRQPDGFRVLYESGGNRYWTHTSYYPGPSIVLPTVYRAQPVYYSRDHRRDWDERGWGHRRDDRDGWRGVRRQHRREYRHHDDD